MLLFFQFVKMLRQVIVLVSLQILLFRFGLRIMLLPQVTLWHYHYIYGITTTFMALLLDMKLFFFTWEAPVSWMRLFLRVIADLQEQASHRGKC